MRLSCNMYVGCCLVDDFLNQIALSEGCAHCIPFLPSDDAHSIFVLTFRTKLFRITGQSLFADLDLRVVFYHQLGYLLSFASASQSVQEHLRNGEVPGCDWAFSSKNYSTASMPFCLLTAAQATQSCRTV